MRHALPQHVFPGQSIGGAPTITRETNVGEFPVRAKARFAHGRKHVEAKHIAALKDCITACTAASDLCSRGSALHIKMCGVCAEACKNCADLCESADDQVMKDCATECRKCEKSCSEMSG